MGYTPIRSVIQLEDIDSNLRTALWNALDICVLTEVSQRIIQGARLESNPTLRGFFMNMWANYFHIPVDQLDMYWPHTRSQIRETFFASPWHDVYSFIEFVAQHFPIENVRSAFTGACNVVLVREVSAYRLVDGTVIRNTNEHEISAIETALARSVSPVQTHLQSAIAHLSNRENPDYRNSIKESVSALEALCSTITGRKATLADALDEIDKRGVLKLHAALKSSLLKLYGYSSDAQGIRHALMDESTLTLDDAMFMLVSCSAFANYLTSKAADAGIKLK
jgi:hypothetical protein